MTNGTFIFGGLLRRSSITLLAFVSIDWVSGWDRPMTARAQSASSR